MEVNTMFGIDLAKATVHVFGVREGTVIIDRSLRRARALEYFSNREQSEIYMEACGGSNWWAQKLSSMGHSVSLISPQFVKPFATRQKNDRNDARAILDAARSVRVRRMKAKTPAQQDLQLLLKIRCQILSERVAIGNQIESLLLEYGVVRGPRQSWQAVLENACNDLTDLARDMLRERVETYHRLYESERLHTRKLEAVLALNPQAQKLMTLVGVGPVIAAAFLSTVHNPEDFKCGRQVAAYLGLVPRQISSGNTIRLTGITKTGNTYLRQALVHGARSWMRSSTLKPNDNDADNVWIRKLVKEKAFNVACVAVANKMARRMWATLKYA